jgi:hypothetical protein
MTKYQSSNNIEYPNSKNQTLLSKWSCVESKMVKNLPFLVIPSKEGIQAFSFLFWIPAKAGMTALFSSTVGTWNLVVGSLY